ncbi:MAG: DUF1501 domain-containing protein, partial [Pseudomonadota bacterium]
FLLGGMDGNDTLLPFDDQSYERYSEIRESLLNLYAAQPGGSSRDQARLLELAPANAADFGTQRFALPEQLTGIKDLFDNGNAAIISNVGPLIEPVDRDQFNLGTADVPARLFSHNDQQSTWQASNPEGAQLGWGGLFGDAAFNAGAASEPDFLTLTSLGNEVFLTGNVIQPFNLGLAGPVEVTALEFFEDQAAQGGDAEAARLIRDHFRAMDFNRSNLFERDMAGAMQGAIDTNDAFNEARSNGIPLATQFPGSFLGAQLRSVAETISIRNALFVNRQVFFVGIGGFDTHDNQADDLPGLHTQIDQAVTAFFSAMQELGTVDDVTLFTASDFGRTLAVNGDGTDHGWGNNHFVVGGAVNGGQIFGQVPPYDFGHDQDAGNGRFIPTIAVDEYAGALGRWFGLTEAELLQALPNLVNFSGRPPLGFV